MPSDDILDVLVLGSGAAGLSLALRLPPAARIAVVAKRDMSEGNTLYAQGGISAVLDAGDSIESHVRDTLAAGVDLCDEATVRLVVERGPANIRWLQQQGTHFTLTSDTPGARSSRHDATSTRVSRLSMPERWPSTPSPHRVTRPWTTTAQATARSMRVS